MPAISIILPVYNGAKYLRESIDSVLGQSFPDFDLHVLDDGSTDNSATIVRSYADRRVRYSKNDVRFGLFKTLNRGCQEAAAEWVRLWAHDDRMTRNSLDAFHRFAMARPEVGMVYCDFFDMDATGRLTGTEVDHQPQRDRTPEVADADRSALLFLTFGCLPGNISTVMVRKDAWVAVGGFAEGIQQAPDYDMWVRLSERFPVGFVRERAVELRGHELQLGRQGHKLTTLIGEERMVFDRLRAGLVPRVMTDVEFCGYWQQYKGRGHFHMVARLLASGNVRLAAHAMRQLAGYGGLGRQAWVWLRTLNGRAGVVDKGAFFDRMATRLDHGGTNHA